MGLLAGGVRAQDDTGGGGGAQRLVTEGSADLSHFGVADRRAARTKQARGVTGPNQAALASGLIFRVVRDPK